MGPAVPCWPTTCNMCDTWGSWCLVWGALYQAKPASVDIQIRGGRSLQVGRLIAACHSRGGCYMIVDKPTVSTLERPAVAWGTCAECERIFVHRKHMGVRIAGHTAGSSCSKRDIGKKFDGGESFTNFWGGCQKMKAPAFVSSLVLGVGNTEVCVTTTACCIWTRKGVDCKTRCVG